MRPLRLLIGLVAFLPVLWPLIRGRLSPSQPQTEESLDSLRRQRDSIYDSLRELDFDLQTGKLSEADYADLSERYKRRAIGLLKQLDDRQRDVLLALDDEIEREVAGVRNTRKAPVAAPSAAKCAVCNTAMESDDLFCRRLVRERRIGGARSNHQRPGLSEGRCRGRGRGEEDHDE